ncbi:hypothetical protein DFS34DRAFT_104898 [Phlyctochytrium arcticum]|nr:hypothetical protein DFS34DRAFT_104898 [Phlyctochytrium arcticum]
MEATQEIPDHTPDISSSSQQDLVNDSPELASEGNEGQPHLVDEAPVPEPVVDPVLVESSLIPDETTLQFLKSLATQSLNPAIQFKDQVPISHPTTRSILGYLTIDLTTSTFAGQECYLLSLSAHFEPESGETWTRSLTTYVDAGLRSLMMAEEGSVVRKDGRWEWSEEWKTDAGGEGGIVVVRRGSRGREDEARPAPAAISKTHAAVLLSGGSQWILSRILSQHPNPPPQPIKFLVFSPTNTLSEIQCSINQNTPDQTIISISPVGGSKTTQSFETDTPTLDAWSEKTIVLGAGQRCLRVSSSDETIILGSPESAASGSSITESRKADQDPYDASDFDGNIELQAEYSKRKEEIKQLQFAYIKDHPELRDIMADYIQLILHRKPQDVYAFTQTCFAPTQGPTT